MIYHLNRTLATRSLFTWEFECQFPMPFMSLLDQLQIFTMNDVIHLAKTQLLFDESVDIPTKLAVFNEINRWIKQHGYWDEDKLDYPPQFLEREKYLTTKHLHHLPTRTQNILKKEEIHSLLEALNFIFLKLKDYKGIGEQNVYLSQLAALDSIYRYTTLSEPEFNQLLSEGIIQMPPKPHFLDHFDDILAVFFKLGKKASSDRNQAIFEKYRLSDEKQTLEKIGETFQLTRERVRQIIEKLESELLALLRGEPLKGLRLPNHIVDQFYQFTQQLSQSRFIYAENVASHDFSHPRFDVLIHIIGYKKIAHHSPYFHFKEPFYTALPSKEIHYILENLKQAIYDDINGVDIDTALSFFNELHIDLINQAELIRIIHNLDDFEIIEHKIYRKFNSLKKLSDIAYKILLERQMPMQIEEIEEEVQQHFNGYKNVARSIAGQLSADNRFSPIGKSGMWTLTQWGIKNKTIKELLIEALSIHHYLTFEGLYHYINVRRTVATNSVKIYLLEKEFIKEQHYYRLRRDDEPFIEREKKSKLTNDIFVQHIFAFFEQNFTASHKLIDLIKYLIEKTALKEVSIRQRLESMDGTLLEIYRENPMRLLNKVRLKENVDKSLVIPQKQDLRHRIQQIILQILEKQEKPITKGDLYLEVSKQISCIKQTFYAYLSEMHEIKQYKKEGKYWVEK